MKVTFNIILSILCLTSWGCYYDDNVPSDQNVWPVSQPQELGMDQNRLIQLDSAIKASPNQAITSVVVVKDGHLVFESYYYENDRSTLFEMGAMSSSLANLALGKAIDMGLIESVEDSIYKYLSDYDQEFEDFPLKKNITFEHLMTMKSGLSWNEITGIFDGQQSDIEKMVQSSDWVEYLITKPLDAFPGSRFTFNSSIPNLIAFIIENEYGDGYHSFLINEVFETLKINNAQIDIIGGNLNAAWGVSMTTLDLAKIGYLFMKEGDWFGQQLVNEDYVNSSISSQTPVDFFNDFGWMWWKYSDSSTFLDTVEENDTFFAADIRGQRLYVVPHLDLVVAITAADQMVAGPALSAPFAFRDYVLGSIQ